MAGELEQLRQEAEQLKNQIRVSAFICITSFMFIVHDIVLRHFATRTSVDCLTCVLVMT